MLTLILYFFKQIPDLPVSDPNFYDITFTEETPNHKHEVRVRGISYASARKLVYIFFNLRVKSNELKLIHSCNVHGLY